MIGFLLFRSPLLLLLLLLTVTVFTVFVVTVFTFLTIFTLILQDLVAKQPLNPIKEFWPVDPFEAS